MYKIDNFVFTDHDIERFNTLGIKPSTVQSWIDDGRAHGISDNGIRQYIKDTFKQQAEEYNRQQNANKADIGDAFRYVASWLPFGTGYDELEAGIRAGGFSGEEYEKYKKEVQDSIARADATFRKNTANGNWFDRNIGRFAPIALNLTGNAGLAVATSGASLMPQASAAQGALEGFLSGNNVGERAARGVAGGAIGYVIPAALNRIFPTVGVQTRTLEQLAKSDSAPEQIVAKAITQRTTPEDVIANEVEKGMRNDLYSNIRRNSVGENVFRRVLQKQSSDTASVPWGEYITNEVRQVSPRYAGKLGDEIERLNLDQLGDDIVSTINPRQIVMDAVNNVMRKASTADRQIVADTMADAVARRGVAKKLSSATIERPISTNSGSIWNISRRLASPLRDLLNRGTLRTISVGTENYVPDNLLERLLNFRTPEALRGAVDAGLEMEEMNSLR